MKVNTSAEETRRPTEGFTVGVGFVALTCFGGEGGRTGCSLTTGSARRFLVARLLGTRVLAVLFLTGRFAGLDLIPILAADLRFSLALALIRVGFVRLGMG
jgi:hypothetical protein